LINKPKSIFADEPSGALNFKSAQEIMNIFTEINWDGVAIFLVTHDAQVAARAERILFMLDGKIVRELKLPKYIEGNAEAASRIEKITEQLRVVGI